MSSFSVSPPSNVATRTHMLRPPWSMLPGTNPPPPRIAGDAPDYAYRMSSESMHISERIRRPQNEVYEYAADPANLPEWAPGLGSAVENVDGQWFVETPMGRVGFKFVERNAYGVLDHEVTLPSGEAIYNPMRLVPDGDGCEAVFTLRRSPGVSDEEFERDARAVADDLARLKEIVEGRNP